MLRQPVPQSLHDGDGGGIVGLGHPHRREAPREPRIGLDVPAPLAPPAGGKEAHRSLREHRPQRIDPSTRAGLHEHVQVVDEEHRVGAVEFAGDVLKALLQRSAHGRPGPDRRHVERPHRRAVQRLRSGLGPARDRAHQPERARTLSHARLPDDDRRVLGAPEQDGGRRAHRIAASHDGVEPPLPGELPDVVAEAGQIAGGGAIHRDWVLGRRLEPAARSRAGEARQGRHIHPSKPRERLDQPGPLIATARHGLEEAHGGDGLLPVLVERERPGVPQKRSERLGEGGAHVGRGRPRLHGDQPRKRGLDGRRIEAGAVKSAHQPRRDVSVADQGEKKPLDGDPAVRLARGVLGRVRERTSRIGVEVLVEVTQIHRRLPVRNLV